MSSARYGRLLIVGRTGDDYVDFALDKPSVTIGRDKSCDIRIVNKEISRHHAELMVEPETQTVWLKSLGREPVSLNGKHVSEATEMISGDRIEVHLENRTRVFIYEANDETMQIAGALTGRLPFKDSINSSGRVPGARKTPIKSSTPGKGAAGTPKSAAKAAKAAPPQRAAAAVGAPPPAPPPPPPPRVGVKPLALKKPLACNGSKAASSAAGKRPTPSGGFVLDPAEILKMRAGLRKVAAEAAGSPAVKGSPAAARGTPSKQQPGSAAKQATPAARGTPLRQQQQPGSTAKQATPAARGTPLRQQQQEAVPARSAAKATPAAATAAQGGKRRKSVRFQVAGTPEGVARDATVTFAFANGQPGQVVVDADSTVAFSQWAMGGSGGTAPLSSPATRRAATPGVRLSTAGSTPGARLSMAGSTPGSRLRPACLASPMPSPVSRPPSLLNGNTPVRKQQHPGGEPTSTPGSPRVVIAAASVSSPRGSAPRSSGGGPGSAPRNAQAAARGGSGSPAAGQRPSPAQRTTATAAPASPRAAAQASPHVAASPRRPAPASPATRGSPAPQPIGGRAARTADGKGGGRPSRLSRVTHGSALKSGGDRPAAAMLGLEGATASPAPRSAGRFPTPAAGTFDGAGGHSDGLTPRSLASRLAMLQQPPPQQQENSSMTPGGEQATMTVAVDAPPTMQLPAGLVEAITAEVMASGFATDMMAAAGHDDQVSLDGHQHEKQDGGGDPGQDGLARTLQLPGEWFGTPAGQRVTVVVRPTATGGRAQLAMSVRGADGAAGAPSPALTEVAVPMDWEGAAANGTPLSALRPLAGTYSAAMAAAAANSTPTFSFLQSPGQSLGGGSWRRGPSPAGIMDYLSEEYSSQDDDAYEPGKATPGEQEAAAATPGSDGSEASEDDDEGYSTEEVEEEGEAPGAGGQQLRHRPAAWAGKGLMVGDSMYSAGRAAAGALEEQEASGEEDNSSGEDASEESSEGDSGGSSGEEEGSEEEEEQRQRGSMSPHVPQWLDQEMEDFDDGLVQLPGASPGCQLLPLGTQGYAAASGGHEQAASDEEERVGGGGSDSSGESDSSSGGESESSESDSEDDDQSSDSSGEEGEEEEEEARAGMMASGDDVAYWHQEQGRKHEGLVEEEEAEHGDGQEEAEYDDVREEGEEEYGDGQMLEWDAEWVPLRDYRELEGTLKGTIQVAKLYMRRARGLQGHVAKLQSKLRRLKGCREEAKRLRFQLMAQDAFVRQSLADQEACGAAMAGDSEYEPPLAPESEYWETDQEVPEMAEEEDSEEDSEEEEEAGMEVEEEEGHAVQIPQVVVVRPPGVSSPCPSADVAQRYGRVVVVRSGAGAGEEERRRGTPSRARTPQAAATPGSAKNRAGTTPMSLSRAAQLAAAHAAATATTPGSPSLSGGSALKRRPSDAAAAAATTPMSAAASHGAKAPSARPSATKRAGALRSPSTSATKGSISAKGRRMSTATPMSAAAVAAASPLAAAASPAEQDAAAEAHLEAAEQLLAASPAAGGMPAAVAEATEEEEQMEHEDQQGEDDDEGDISSDSDAGEAQTQEEADEEEEAEEEADVCVACGCVDEGDILLLCDGCDAAYHLACCQPPLRRVPQGDWHCHGCREAAAAAAAAAKKKTKKAQRSSRAAPVEELQEAAVATEEQEPHQPLPRRSRSAKKQRQQAVEEEEEDNQRQEGAAVKAKAPRGGGRRSSKTAASASAAAAQAQADEAADAAPAAQPPAAGGNGSSSRASRRSKAVAMLEQENAEPAAPAPARASKRGRAAASLGPISEDGPAAAAGEGGTLQGSHNNENSAPPSPAAPRVAAPVAKRTRRSSLMPQPASYEGGAGGGGALSDVSAAAINVPLQQQRQQPAVKASASAAKGADASAGRRSSVQKGKRGTAAAAERQEEEAAATRGSRRTSRRLRV